MCVKVYEKCKPFKKADRSMQKCIYERLIRLEDKIVSTGYTDVNLIFSDDSITYDRISKDLFVYKTHGPNNQQIRVVYGYDGSNIYLVDFVNKKANNKQYLSDLGVKFRNMSLCDMNFFEVRFA